MKDLFQKEGEMEMSLNEVIRCLAVNVLLTSCFVCIMIVNIAINSSKILKQLEKINKDKKEIVRCKDCKYCGSEIRDGVKFANCELHHNWMPQADWFCADGEKR